MTAPINSFLYFSLFLAIRQSYASTITIRTIKKTPAITAIANKTLTITAITS